MLPAPSSSCPSPLPAQDRYVPFLLLPHILKPSYYAYCPLLRHNSLSLPQLSHHSHPDPFWSLARCSAPGLVWPAYRGVASFTAISRTLLPIGGISPCYHDSVTPQCASPSFGQVSMAYTTCSDFHAALTTSLFFFLFNPIHACTRSQQLVTGLLAGDRH